MHVKVRAGPGSEVTEALLTVMRVLRLPIAKKQESVTRHASARGTLSAECRNRCASNGQGSDVTTSGYGPLQPARPHRRKIRASGGTDDRAPARGAIAFACAIAVTAGFLASLAHLLSEQSQWSLQKPEYIDARLIDETIPPEPVAPGKSAWAPRAAATFAKPAATRALEMPAALPVAPARSPALDLFTRDGAVHLPSGDQAKLPQHDDATILSHRDLIPVEPERFAWTKPARESLGGALMRKIYNHEWTMPWGTFVSCVQGVPTRETPIVIECRPGKSGATSDELRAMRADPPAQPEKKAHRSASFARREQGGGTRSFAALRQ